MDLHMKASMESQMNCKQILISGNNARKYSHENKPQQEWQVSASSRYELAVERQTKTKQEHRFFILVCRWFNTLER